MVLVGICWAGHYVWTVQGDPKQDENALAMIGPMMWILALFGAAIVVQTLLQTATALEETHGLNDWRRLIYLFGLVLFVPLLLPLGYLVVAPIFFAAMAWILGMRRPVVLITTTLGLAALIYIGFAELLQVNLPLYPGSDA